MNTYDERVRAGLEARVRALIATATQIKEDVQRDGGEAADAPVRMRMFEDDARQVEADARRLLFGLEPGAELAEFLADVASRARAVAGPVPS